MSLHGATYTNGSNEVLIRARLLLRHVLILYLRYANRIRTTEYTCSFALGVY